MKTLHLHFPPRNSISKKRRNLLSTKGGKKKEGGRIEACRPERVSWRKNRISRSPSNFIRRSIDRSTCTRLSFHFLPSNYAIIALISDNRQLSCIQRLVSAVDKQDCSLFPSIRFDRGERINCLGKRKASRNSFPFSRGELSQDKRRHRITALGLFIDSPPLRSAR